MFVFCLFSDFSCSWKCCNTVLLWSSTHVLWTCRSISTEGSTFNDCILIYWGEIFLKTSVTLICRLLFRTSLSATFLIYSFRVKYALFVREHDVAVKCEDKLLHLLYRLLLHIISLPYFPFFTERETFSFFSQLSLKSWLISRLSYLRLFPLLPPPLSFVLLSSVWVEQHHFSSSSGGHTQITALRWRMIPLCFTGLKKYQD